MSKRQSRHHKADGSPRYFSDQMDDEEVLFVFRRHPVVMRRGLILFMLSILVGACAVFVAEPNFTTFGLGIAGGLVVGGILFFPGWVGWFYSTFIVTDKRFIQVTQKGFFHRSVVDIELKQIQTVNYEVAGLQQTLLGFGTIMMQTYIGDLIIHEIHHPAKIQKHLLSILREEGIEQAPFPKRAAETIEEDNEDDDPNLEGLEEVDT